MKNKEGGVSDESEWKLPNPSQEKKVPRQTKPY